MDRTALAGMAIGLVALCPVSTMAQPAAPTVAHTQGTPPRFGLLAGPSKSDVAWNTSGDELVQKVGLQDPAVQISAGVAAAIAKRKGGSVVESGKSDLIVKVETTKWSAGYFVPSRPTYTVEYDAQLTITDASGAVVKTAECLVTPDDRTSAGSNDEFVAHNGKTLKTYMAKAAEDCQRSLISKTKAV